MTQSDLTLKGLTGNLAALSLGEQDGVPVLALHGWLDNAASFVPLSEHLNEVQLVALDLPGHGHSEHRPEGSNYHFTDYIADVAHVVVELGWEKFHLVGHSLGAGIAILYSALYPEQVESLVLIDGVGPTTANVDSATGRLRKSIDASTEARAKRAKPARYYPDWATLISARQQASPITAQGAELLVRRNAIATEEGIRMRSDRRLRHPSALYLSEELVSHFITGVTARSLIILAANGNIGSREITDQRIAKFANASVAHCPGNHHLHMDSPQPIGELISRFLLQT